MCWVFTVLVLDAINYLLGAMMLIELVRLILILVLFPDKIFLPPYYAHCTSYQKC